MGRYEGVPSKFLTATGIDPEAVRKVKSLRVFEEEGEEDDDVDRTYYGPRLDDDDGEWDD